jgi:hypothetical protein
MTYVDDACAAVRLHGFFRDRTTCSNTRQDSVWNYPLAMRRISIWPSATRRISFKSGLGNNACTTRRDFGLRRTFNGMCSCFTALVYLSSCSCSSSFVELVLLLYFLRRCMNTHSDSSQYRRNCYSPCVCVLVAKSENDETRLHWPCFRIRIHLHSISFLVK